MFQSKRANFVGVKIFYYFQESVLSRTFLSAENFGPGDQNSWKIGPPDHYFLKILVRTWNYGPSENTLV